MKKYIIVVCIMLLVFCCGCTSGGQHFVNIKTTPTPDYIKKPTIPITKTITAIAVITTKIPTVITTVIKTNISKTITTHTPSQLINIANKTPLPTVKIVNYTDMYYNTTTNNKTFCANGYRMFNGACYVDAQCPINTIYWYGSCIAGVKYVYAN